MIGCNSKDFDSSHEDYLRDESRRVGNAESISFPQSADEVSEILSACYSEGIQVTLQGARTGVTAGAVPFGGHIMNLSRMNKITGLRYGQEKDEFSLRVQPGVLLSQIRGALEPMEFNTTDWSDESRRALALLSERKAHFFPPDPTETSASIGGMISCDASGARTFKYGSTRRYVEVLDVVLVDGSRVALKRGERFAEGRRFTLQSSSGVSVEGDLPSYALPRVKDKSGYYAADNMDLIDMFVGSEGTLGVVTEAELRLIPAPGCIWGVTTFFPCEESAIRFVRAVRGEKVEGVSASPSCIPAAIEYFNHNTLDLLRTMRETGGTFAQLPELTQECHTAIYVEYHGDGEESIADAVMEASEMIVSCGGDDEAAWIATDPSSMRKMHFFRHATPEAVNLVIDERRKAEPNLTKLGTDMAATDRELERILSLYNRKLEEAGLESVMFGHIGNNHIHVNIIPRTMDEYNRGKELYLGWAREIIAMGGTVSAEHGIGKLKTVFLREMYGDEGISQMRALKRLFDPKLLLNRGNLFDAD